MMRAVQLITDSGRAPDGADDRGRDDLFEGRTDPPWPPAV